MKKVATEQKLKAERKVAERKVAEGKVAKKAIAPVVGRIMQS